LFHTLRIARRIAPFVTSFLRDRRRWVVAGEPIPRTPEFHQTRAHALVDTIAGLGPSFVKLAQVFAARADLIPEPYIGALGRLTDQVPPISLEEVERTIVEAYGRSPEELFERFDPQPIAAASLGQVHRARYAGEEVVVKVLRPRVEEMVARDVVAAKRLLALVERRFAANPHVRGMRAIIDEFSLRIGDEMDFRKEAENAVQIRANFAGNRRVAVPRIVPELVRQRVLVMEYMEGTKIDALAPLVAAGRLDANHLVASVIELYLQMMLVDGFFHADPHPGNLLVASDGTVVILDFGMVVRVPRETRWNLVQTVYACIRRDVDGIVAGFDALGLLEPTADREKIRELAHTLLGIAYTDTTMAERMDLVANEVMATLYDFPVVLPSDMVYFARTAALIEGIGVRYDDRFNAILVATPVALRMRRRILSSLGAPPASMPPLDWATAVGTVAGQVAGFLARAGRGLLAALERDLEPRIEARIGTRSQPRLRAVND
jgi:predicted unusual protein kinase regulating ubiquinone biosynthesis (AarF/ABC1/UbiB family)